jgi:ABC-type arginine/histidine transport system permease subunit
MNLTEQPIPLEQPMPHRKVIREWLVPLSERVTLRALLLLVLDYAIWAALLTGTVLFEAWWAKLLCAMAMGFTTAQTYRYVMLPMAFRIILPPLTSESMNLLKNSSVAFAVSIAELTMFAMQAQEETSRGVEVYLAVTALYALSAFAVNRVFALIEKRVQIPGFVVAGGTGGGH